ncbi:MAG: GntR family transcriptional regulator [Rectinemataceae bacterium]|nr:GntR family transcriptional regulator [Spirochaetaceae bacterium]
MNRRSFSIFDYTSSTGVMSAPRSRKEEAYRRILEIVLSGSLDNDAFLNEQPLAEQFGMSRAPVREALQMLCSERILENVPRMGYRVVPISIRETLDAIHVRLLLEQESVRLACRNRSPEALAKIDALIRQQKKIEEDETSIHSWILQGDLVHRTIAELSGNMILMRTIVSLIDLLRRASIQLLLGGVDKPLEIHYHMRLLEAVRRGDEREALELVTRDCQILQDLIWRQ